MPSEPAQQSHQAQQIQPTQQAEQAQGDLLDITSLNSSGQGVGRLGQMVVFVDGAVPGDQVRVEILRQAKSYVIGKILEIVRPSPDRIDPPCEAAPRCGGCSLQHMSYPAQCKWKETMVLEAMNRIGKFDREELSSLAAPILAMEDPFHYRNIVQLPVSGTSEHPVLGFYEKDSHAAVDTDLCLIQPPVFDGIRETIRTFIRQNHISIYDEATGKGVLRHLVIRVGFRTKQVMVILVLNPKDLPSERRGELKDAVVRQLEETVRRFGLELVSIFANLNDERTNLVYGSRFLPIFGRDHLEEILCGIRYRISPGAFFQVNTVQAEKLYEKVAEFANLTPQDTVYDLYCGAGSISLVLAGRCKRVIGVEAVSAAIADAKENARRNNIHNAEFHAGRAEVLFPRFVGEGSRADAVVVDPPRKGLDNALIEAIVKMAPPKIVYVSCAPATLARDCRLLAETGGYRLQKLQPVDLFPWTGHTEAVILLQRLKT